MIRMMIDNCLYPIYLFAQNRPHQHMGQSQFSKRKQQIRPIAGRLQMPVSAADQETNLRTAVSHPFFNLSRQFQAFKVFAAFVQDNYFGAVRN